MKKEEMTTKDYIFCEDCQTYVDFWKYDHNIEDAGHEDCEWRYVDDAELIVCVQNCVEDGCFDND